MRLETDEIATLNEMRLEAGVSYETFAEWIGVSGHTVYRVLNYEQPQLYATTVHKFRRFLDARLSRPTRHRRRSTVSAGAAS